MNFIFLLFVIFILCSNFINCTINDTKIDQSVRISDILLAQCNVDRNSLTPSEYTDNPTVVSTAFRAFRLKDVNDIDESFSVNGGFIDSWHVPCVEKLLKNASIYKWPKVERDEEPVTLDPTQYWAPDIVHFNSFKRKPLISDSYTRRMYVIQNGTFTEFFFGDYESVCSLDFWSFPFDRQVN